MSIESRAQAATYLPVQADVDAGSTRNKVDLLAIHPGMYGPNRRHTSIRRGVCVGGTVPKTDRRGGRGAF